MTKEGAKTGRQCEERMRGGRKGRERRIEGMRKEGLHLHQFSNSTSRAERGRKMGDKEFL